MILTLEAEFIVYDSKYKYSRTESFWVLL